MPHPAVAGTGSAPAPAGASPAETKSRLRTSAKAHTDPTSAIAAAIDQDRREGFGEPDAVGVIERAASGGRQGVGDLGDLA